MVSALTPRTDRIESQAKLGNVLATQQGYMSFVDVSLINASTTNGFPVNSVVLNLDGTRRYIYDLANDLGCRMGIERICLQQIYEIQTEVAYGSNSGIYNGNIEQKVWGVIGDKLGQIRLIGNWSTFPSTYGTRISSGSAGDYIELWNWIKYVSGNFSRFYGLRYR
jgi:hypothetical protein